MATLGQIVNAKLDRLESVPISFLTKMEVVEKALFRELTVLMADLEIVNGVIILTDANLALISPITQRLELAMFAGEYTNAMTTFLSEFETQAILNNQIFEKEFGRAFTDKEVFTSVTKRAQRDILGLLDEGAMDANLMTPLREVLNNSVTTQQTFKEAVKQVEDFMVSGDEHLGRLRNYASTFTMDAFNNADRRYTNVLAVDFDVQWFMYIGGLIRDSREFCVDRAGQVFHTLEIESWGAGKNVGAAGNPWQGRNPNTNTSSIFILLGGYNCLHSLLPVDASSVPQSAIDRALLKGFITE